MAELTLHSYQDEIADQLYGSDAIVAVCEVGSGKTLSTLTAIRDMIKAGEADRAIIFAPKRVAQTVWEAENDKFALGLRVVTLTGKTPAERVKLMRQDFDVLVINYELAEWLYTNRFRADARMIVIFDEVSRLKSAAGRRRKDILKVCRDATTRWGLTATPKGDSPMDLWGIADAVQPGVWGGFYPWRGTYFRAIDRDGFQFKVIQGCEELIDDQFSELSFKLRDGQVPNSGVPVYIPETVIMPAQAMEQYNEFADELILELDDGVDIMVEHELSAGMKMRQIASGFVYDDNRRAHWLHHAKLDALKDIVETSGDNILVLYQFLPEVEIIRRYWPDLEVLGGETTDKAALDIITRWNKGEIKMLAGHPRSMGHGLNLQFGGHRVVWFSLTWSMEDFHQANGRIQRQGQERQVYVHTLEARGTIDRKVARALRGKETRQKELFDVLREV